MRKFIGCIFMVVVLLTIVSGITTSRRVAAQSETCTALQWEQVNSLQYHLPELFSEPDYGWSLSKIAWHPTGDFVAFVASWDVFNNVGVFNVNDRHVLFEMPSIPLGPLRSFSWSPDGRFLSLSADSAYSGDTFNSDNIMLWGLLAEEYFYLLPTRSHTDRGTSLAWRPDSSRFATISNYPSDLLPYGQQDLRIWTVADSEPIQIFDPLPSEYMAMAWHPTEDKLAIADDDQTVIFDLESEAIVASIQQGAKTLAWHPEGRRLAGGMGQGRPESQHNMWLWDLETDTITEPFAWLDVEDFLQWSFDGTFIVSGRGTFASPEFELTLGHLESGTVAVLSAPPHSTDGEAAQPPARHGIHSATKLRWAIRTGASRWCGSAASKVIKLRLHWHAEQCRQVKAS
ncbi:MAG: WD40 repeat domain-containing protein [Anaerolineae bacterium]|nr:WD40 repeat domain-containing protein [Anaerolineae bacterium]